MWVWVWVGMKERERERGREREREREQLKVYIKCQVTKSSKIKCQAIQSVKRCKVSSDTRC